MNQPYIVPNHMVGVVVITTMVFSLTGITSVQGMTSISTTLLNASTTFKSSGAVKVWTFSIPGVSHICFSPQLQNVKFQHLQLSFRSLQPNGLLVHHFLKNYDKDAFLLLNNYELLVELRRGQLQIGYNFNHYQDTLTVGKALNDNRWHFVDLKLNSTDGELKITLDANYSSIQFLKAYLWGNAREILQWSQLPSVFKFGAAKDSSSGDFSSFIGCMKDLKYSGRDIPIDVAEGVSAGCIDRCQEKGRCINSGRCVNLYTDFHCDCFGTDFEGASCAKQGPSTLTFSGYEWVTYKLYEREENRFYSDNNRFSLEFKSNRPSGILLYAVGSTPYHNHITASIYSGVLYVSLGFGSEDVDFNVGFGLDDNRWHNLTIHHVGRSVHLYLDDDVSSKLIKNNYFFLSLDPVAYIGGGNNFVITRGLPVTKNFIGCMKNVYFGDKSVLYLLSDNSQSCKYHGGEKPSFGCKPYHDIPISFPTSASALGWSTDQRSENLTVEFQFRTVRLNSIMFYVELLSRRDGGEGYDFGVLEVWVNNGQPMMVFIPSSRNETFSENITFPIIVNDAKWHSMLIKIEHSQAKVKVDSLSKNTNQYKKLLEHRGHVMLGFGLRSYKQNEGYVGCMEKIVIQGVKLDPITVVNSDTAIGLKLDGCYLVDYCSINNICEHGSECLSDWNGVHCDCKNLHYEGKACHFSKYKTNCDSYYQFGHIESGVYIIDVDGPGPQDHAYVHCDMGIKKNGYLYGVTVVEHNFAKNTPVRSPFLADRQYTLAYREMNRNQLLTLTQSSKACEQYFKYDCLQSPIRLGKKTLFKAASGKMVDYLGSEQPGFCICPDEILCNGERCYCDIGEKMVKTDDGFNQAKQQLPFTEMTFLQNDDNVGFANMTLGPLQCWGNELQPLDPSVTLTTEESYLKLHTWQRGDLRLHFKTYQNRAIILMQTSTNTQMNNRFILSIVSAYNVEFDFFINETHIIEILSTSQPLNQGDWHQISIEHDAYDLRLNLDLTQKLIPLDSTVKGILDYNSELYIGGLPNDISGFSDETKPGLTGCIRGFVYNDQAVDLTQLIDDSTIGVSKNCQSSCWPNPCQHGGICRESWGTYTCRCQDLWAHQGNNCEHNLNEDAVTLSGKANSYLKFDLTHNPGVLDQTIVLSFRTFQSDALILYAHDHMSNFVQIELQQASHIIFTYNSNHSIVRGFISAPDKLNDGEWKQVVVQDYYSLTKLIFGDHSEIIQFRRIKLHSYDMDPFKDSQLRESVFLPRPYLEPKPFVHLYIGGLEDAGTTAPYLNGCVRGMRIGNLHINLRGAAEARRNVSDVTPACENGCKKNKDTCMNNGYCSEHWMYGNFTCDCSDTDFSGIYCEKEASVLLTGQSIIEHKFKLPLSAQQTNTEQFTLQFRTTTANLLKSGKDMVLIYIKGRSDYIIAKLDSEGNILIETNQGFGIYRMKVLDNFANGELHELLYVRAGTHMHLTVRPLDSKGGWIIDGIREAKNDYPVFDLSEIDTIFIGGLLPDEEQFENVVNFTGCISNTVFTPETGMPLKLRSLKDFHLNSEDVKVLGPQVNSCSSFLLMGKPVTEIPTRPASSTEKFEILTLPVWDVGPAHVVTLHPPKNYTDLITTTDHPPPKASNSSAIMIQNPEPADNDLLVIIAVTLVGGILLLALLIAIFLLFRKRKRQYDVKKEIDTELIQPLNHHSIVPVQSSPVPPDHLAKLDEFSMITALLGPKNSSNAIAPIDTARHSQGSLTKVEDCIDFINPIFNKRKQRPASSISEVLEELERRQMAKNNASTEDIVGRSHGEGDLEWDPQTDCTPLTYEDISFFNTPLLAPILDENEASHVSSFSGKLSNAVEKNAEKSEATLDELQGNQSSLLDGNGDSGYEAESRPENTEEDATPEITGDDGEFHDDNDNEELPEKLYMYNISNMPLDDSPNHSSLSQCLLSRNSKDT